MPQVTNTFIRSKMNKDLDNRLLPNGEYRDAQNLQLSRSEGSEVGEFENVLQNKELTYLYTGKQFLPLGFVKYFGKIIGQFTDETTENIYIFSSGYDGLGSWVTSSLIAVYEISWSQTNHRAARYLLPY